MHGAAFLKSFPGGAVLLGHAEPHPVFDFNLSSPNTQITLSAGGLQKERVGNQSCT